MPHFLLQSLKSWWSRKILQFTLQVIFKKTLIILHFIFHIFYAGINSSMVLKSEQQNMEAKRSNKKKQLGEVNLGIHFHRSEKTSLTLVQWTTRGFWKDIFIHVRKLQQFVSPRQNRRNSWAIFLYLCIM